MLPMRPAVIHPDPDGRPAALRGPVTFVGHMDICPENVIFRDGHAATLIDFDLAAHRTAFANCARCCSGGRANDAGTRPRTMRT